MVFHSNDNVNASRLMIRIAEIPSTGISNKMHQAGGPVLASFGGDYGIKITFMIYLFHASEKKHANLDFEQNMTAIFTKWIWKKSDRWNNFIHFTTTNIQRVMV